MLTEVSSLDGIHGLDFVIVRLLEVDGLLGRNQSASIIYGTFQEGIVRIDGTFPRVVRHPKRKDSFDLIKMLDFSPYSSHLGSWKL